MKKVITMLFVLMVTMVFAAGSAFAFNPISFSIGYKGGTLKGPGAVTVAQHGTIVGVTVDATGYIDDSGNSITGTGAGSASATMPTPNQAAAGIDTTSGMAVSLTSADTAVAADALAQESATTDVMSSIVTNSSALYNGTPGAVCVNFGWGF